MLENCGKKEWENFLAEWFSVPEHKNFQIMLPWAGKILSREFDFQMTKFDVSEDRIRLVLNNNPWLSMNRPDQKDDTAIEILNPRKIYVNQRDELCIEEFDSLRFDWRLSPWPDETNEGCLNIVPTEQRQSLTYPTIKPVIQDRKTFHRQPFPGLKSIVDSEKDS